ncbi:MAG: hypothetical protein IJP26_03210, partial [Clostridia bacterium]|nr:hypothetical protein [Clostridia bacterium]
MSFFKKIFGNYSEKELKRLYPIQQKVLGYEAEYKALSDQDLRAKTDEFKSRIANGESLDSI